MDKLVRPFKCPGSATVKSTRSTAGPPRKRRRVTYTGADGGGAGSDEEDKPYSNDDRLALATRDANRFPVFKPKDKDALFRQRFSVPLINKDTTSYNAGRAPPLLGLRQGKVFVARPLHDPSGEFAIVLYDPTVDDRQEDLNDVEAAGSTESKKESSQEDKKVQLDVPLVHKSLADILGLKKTVEEVKKVPVVIDPRLAKVLRPHQVEGVKACVGAGARFQPLTVCSFYIAVPPDLLIQKRMAASWQTKWDWERLYAFRASCPTYGCR